MAERHSKWPDRVYERPRQQPPFRDDLLSTVVASRLTTTWSRRACQTFSRIGGLRRDAVGRVSNVINKHGGDGIGSPARGEYAMQGDEDGEERVDATDVRYISNMWCWEVDSLA